MSYVSLPASGNSYPSTSSYGVYPAAVAYPAYTASPFISSAPKSAQSSTKLGVGIVFQGIALICFIVATATPGWIYASSTDGLLSLYTGLWQACIQTTSTNCDWATLTPADNTTALNLARAFSIMQCLTAFIAIVAQCVVLRRVARDHMPRTSVSKWTASISLLFGTAAFVLCMWALAYFDADAGAWSVIGKQTTDRNTHSQRPCVSCSQCALDAEWLRCATLC